MTTADLSPAPAALLADLSQYVGFTANAAAALRDAYPFVAPDLARIVDDLCDDLLAPSQRAGVTNDVTNDNEPADRAPYAAVRAALGQWLDSMLLGPHDARFFDLRGALGRLQLQLAVPQSQVLLAMSRLRARLCACLKRRLAEQPAAYRRAGEALHQALDMEIAMMIDPHRAELMARQREAERLATVGQFAASIGHELRNPLAVIDSSVHLARQHLERAGTVAPEVAKHLDRIRREVGRSVKTIQDLLALARDVPPHRAPTPLRPLIQSALGEAALAAGIRVDVDVAVARDSEAQAPEPDLVANVDGDQIRRVLVNLFANASDALNAAGHIWVDARRVGDGIRVRVRDDGPGVPEPIRERIFDPVFTTKAHGSGLGLALCRRIVQAHGGAIHVEPSSSGAIFVLWLPDLRSRHA